MTSEKRCLRCSEPGGLVVTPVLTVDALGEYALSGVMHKAPAREMIRLSCELCGWSRLGWLEGAEIEDGVITSGYFKPYMEGEETR